MAQLLSPTAAPTRISQILPTVKCSSCNQQIQIADLGDHVCAQPPPLPKPAMAPIPASFLPKKYQTLISSPPSASPAQKTPMVAPAPVIPPPRQHTPMGSGSQWTRDSKPASPAPVQPLRVRTSSAASPLKPQTAPGRAEHVSSPLSREGPSDAQKVAFPTRSGPSEPPRVPSPQSYRPSEPRRAPSPQSYRHPSEPLRVSSPLSMSSRTSSESQRLTSPLANRAYPGPASPPPPLTAPAAPVSRARAPSNASLRPGPDAVRQPVRSSPTPYVPPPAVQNNMSALAPPASRPRAATNASGPPSFSNPDVIYSTGNSPGSTPGPATRARAPSSASLNPGGGPSRVVGGGAPPPQVPFPSQTPSPPEIDTKTGGEAGMAGVGRRGFAAAARAAMFTHNLGHGPMSGHPPSLAPGMDGRRANAPAFLDIVSATNYANIHTPPLTPSTGNSPHSPYSQSSPLSATVLTSHPDGRTSVTPTLPIHSEVGARTPSPSNPHRPPSLQRDQVKSPPLEPPKSPLQAPPSTPSSPSFKLPFFEKFKNKLPNVDTVPAPEPPAKQEPSPLSPTTDPESEFGGLAYADSSDEDEPLAKSPAAKGAIKSEATVVKTPGKVRFPSMSSKTQSIIKSESKYSASSSSSSTQSPRLPMRSLSASTATSSYSVRSAAKSTGALDRAMETLFEEDPSSPTSTTSTSIPAVLPLALVGQRDSKPPKLPTRSHTSPTLGSSRPESKVSAVRRPRQPKVCVKCEKGIEDGRWIQMEGGSMLCDRCWKNMYLPKCRRCNLTIEKQAVSSSDGQLKGKYHRECFNCHTCHKPFPDKSFYVLDGKPFCAYHYHEANDSLCAATMCGQPIEGPCAVSHAGDRYHPEHLTCEYARCAERLAEYWEVDGRMLCDRHAQRVMREEQGRGEEDEGSAEGGEGEGYRDSSAARATKRVTVFIDLAALGGSELQ